MSDIIRIIPYTGWGSWQEPVPSVADLPTFGSEVGDVKITTDTQEAYVWNGTSWVLFASPSFAAGIVNLNGLSISTQFLATGTSGSDFNISSATATHTFNLPDAGPSARGVITNIAQTIAGTKTFSSAPIISLFGTAGVVHNDGTGLLSSSLIVNADVDAAAAISYSKLNLVNSIVDADISSLASISRIKIAAGTPNHVIINDGSGLLTSEAQLALTRGGTNASLTAINGGVVYSNASAFAITTAGTSGQLLQSNGAAAPTWISQSALTGIDHGNLTGLLDDDHTQYALLQGRLGGQVLNGGTAASNILELRSTTNGTKGFVYVPETTASTSPTTGAFQVAGGVGVSESLYIANDFGIVSNDDNYIVQQFSVTTTDATVTTLASFTIANNSTQLIEARITAFRTAGGGANADSANYVRTGKGKNNAGTVTLQGLQTSYTQEDVAGWNATLDASGTDVRVRVTGAAATTIVWRCTVIRQINAG